MNKNKKKMLRDFGKLAPLYKEVAKDTRRVLLAQLKNGEYKYQHVSSRVKKTKSLAKKIDKPEHRRKTNVNQFDDLCGCRVIFYLNEDAEKFKRNIYENFKVVEYKQRYSQDGYNGDHYVVKLKQGAMSPQRYAKIKDLKCEIQVTTVLFHAWSEMHHEVYKQQEEFKRFAPEQLKTLQARFSSIMEEHLKPASYDFSVAYREIERIKNGMQTFSLDYFNGIIGATSINDLHEALSSLKNDVQYFSEDKTPEGLNLIQILKDSIAKSANFKIEPIRTEWGELPAKTVDDIIDVSLQILSALSYQLPIETLEFFADYVSYENKIIRDRAARAIKELASYKLNILERYGVGLQQFLLDHVEKWDEKELRKKFQAALIVCEELLEPSAGDTEGDYRSVTLKSATLSATDTLKGLRKRAIKLLQKLFFLSQNLGEKSNVISVLAKASMTPLQSNYGNDMEAMILSDIEDIIDFYIRIVPDQEKAIIQYIENKCFWFLRRRIENGIVPKNIDQFKSLVAADPEYQVYKALIGFDSILPEQWENPELGWNERESFIKARIENYVADVTEDSFDLWLSRLKEYSLVKSDDGAFFLSLSSFLSDLGKQKPEIALKLIVDHGENLGEGILFDLLKGLWSSSSKATAKEIVKTWSAESKHLWLCASLMTVTEDFDLEVANNIFNHAIATQDNILLISLLNAIFSGQQITDASRVALFLKIIKQFSKDKDARWVRSIRCTINFSSIFPALSESNVDLILDSLIPVPDIRYDVNRILIPIVQNFPEKIVGFFEKRIAAEDAAEQTDKKQPKKFGPREYDAVPFNFFELAEPMAVNGEKIIPLIFEWFGKGWRYDWEASHLLNAVFPSMGETLEQQLLSLVATGRKRNVLIVLRVLNDKRGNSSILDVAKAIIRKFPNDKEYQSKLMLALEATGVVTGEYGFAEQYKLKIEQTNAWLSDENEHIRKFAKAYHKRLEKRIVEEQKRGDDSIAIRKRVYGERKPDKKDSKDAA